jgi:predicted transposase YdaD
MFEPLLSDIKKSRFYQEVTEERNREIAKTMLRKNFTFELISEITGLSQEEILALSQELRDGKN